MNPISIFGYNLVMSLLPIDEFLAGNWKIVFFLLATWILPETPKNVCKIHSQFYSSLQSFSYSEHFLTLSYIFFRCETLFSLSFKGFLLVLSQTVPNQKRQICIQDILFSRQVIHQIVWEYPFLDDQTKVIWGVIFVLSFLTMISSVVIGNFISNSIFFKKNYVDRFVFYSFLGKIMICDSFIHIY